MGVAVRRYMYIDFLILLIPTPHSSCICSFLQQHPYFFNVLSILCTNIILKYGRVELGHNPLVYNELISS